MLNVFLRIVKEEVKRLSFLLAEQKVCLNILSFRCDHNAMLFCCSAFSFLKLTFGVQFMIRMPRFWFSYLNITF